MVYSTNIKIASLCLFKSGGKKREAKQRIFKYYVIQKQALCNQATPNLHINEVFRSDPASVKQNDTPVKSAK